MAAPKVLSLSGWWAEPGEEVTISGIDFGPSQGSKIIYVGGVPASAVRWASGEVSFVVPDHAPSGYVGIGTPAACSNGIYLVVETRASVTSISPSVARPGERVTLTGSGFGGSLPTSKVVLHGGATFPVVSWSPTAVEAIVPSGIESGYVGVSKRGVTSNGLWLSVLGPNAEGE
jgi:hypothetical protein